MTSRRTFLKRSATSAAALTLGPLAGNVALAEGIGTAAPVTNRMMRARPVPLSRVRVTGGPLRHAQDLTAKYLLELDPNRMMAFYRAQAGLTPRGEPLTGWDGGGRNLTGHIAGHYLSGVSLMYQATGDARFKARADQVVREMKEVQDKNGDGYVGALEGLRKAFAEVSKGDIRSGAFDLNGLWSPWYTLHKTYAGLRDAYRHTGNRTALEVEGKFAAWAEGVLKPLTEPQVQKMLLTEFGGMNEVLVDLYADTGNTRWLALAQRFEHRAFTDALKRHQDNLAGKHGNCQIPKLIGSAARYGYTGAAEDIMAASFFWDRVVQHHSYATGGHGNAEYFGHPDQLSARVDGRTCETCNDYNMLKLTRMLFAFRPDAFYADFHERALFNHILASIDPTDGRTSYMVPVGRGVQQEYQDLQRDFTCCVGSGMESHALHGDGVYYETDDTLFVNLFVPSTAQFTTGKVLLRMETGFPDGDTASIALAMPKPTAFTLALRRPGWAGDAFVVKVNGAIVEQPPLASLRAGSAGGRAYGNEDRGLSPSSYVELARTWKQGDVVEVTIPKSLRLEPTPDNPSVTAIMWGPLVLAGDHGPRRTGRGSANTADPVPALVAAEHPLSDWLAPSGSRAGDFTARGVARVPGSTAAPADLALTPFHRTHRRNYSVYFDLLTPAGFDARVAAIAAERERVRKLEEVTVGYVKPGDQALEREYNFRSDPASRAIGQSAGRSNRSGAGWFSFDMPVDAKVPMALVVTYSNDLGLPPLMADFEILVDGTTIARFERNGDAATFFDATYTLPPPLLEGKSKVTVRFQAGEKSRVIPVFGVRIIRT